MFRKNMNDKVCIFIITAEDMHLSNGATYPQHDAAQCRVFEWPFEASFRSV
jgi:hypothetical protein